MLFDHAVQDDKDRCSCMHLVLFAALWRRDYTASTVPLQRAALVVVSHSSDMQRHRAPHATPMTRLSNFQRSPPQPLSSAPIIQGARHDLQGNRSCSLALFVELLVQLVERARHVEYQSGMC